MTKEFTLVLPKLGESIVSATIVQILKKEGEEIQKDEPIFTVTTDKVTSEIPSPVGGRIQRVFVVEGQEIQVGEALAMILTEEDILEKKGPENFSEKILPETTTFFSPAVLEIAKQHHVSMQELQKIQGTGEEGRVTKKDLRQYLTTLPTDEDTEIVKMSPMRKIIAENMVKSFYQAPHAYLMTEIDVTEVMKYIEVKKREFLSKYRIKISITSFLAYAISRAAQEFSFFNASVKNDTIYKKKNVNLGIAISIKEGLVVPVIKKSNTLSLTEIVQHISDFSSRAKKAKLFSEEMQEGSITLTNFGMTGVMMGLPIIRYPEVAIIGAGAIQKKQIYPQTTLRSVLMLTLAFDHRVADGIYACSFLNKIKEILEHNKFQVDL